ncbi:MAG: tautomerase family protein [Chloroflexi bacterium]|nr:tautomerase family protein [Chloroflexota bacterium]
MPVIRVEMLAGRTKAQKAELARVITEAVASIANARPQDTTVVFVEFPRENWATGGVLRSES